MRCTTPSSSLTKDQSVLALPELFHLILLHLPLGDILTRAIRVCKSWRDTIDTSRVIQQVLFFQPFHQRPGVARIVNPFMDSVFSDYRGIVPKPLGPPTASWRKMFISQPPIDQIFCVTKPKQRLLRRMTPVGTPGPWFAPAAPPEGWVQEFSREEGVLLSTTDEDHAYALDLRFVYGNCQKGHAVHAEDHWQWKRVVTGMNVLRHLGKEM